MTPKPKSFRDIGSGARRHNKKEELIGKYGADEGTRAFEKGQYYVNQLEANKSAAPQGGTTVGQELLNPDYVLPTTTTPKIDPLTGTAVSPLNEKWDYKTANYNPQGEALQTVQFGKWKLDPKGFDPNGDVYFGGGVGGWFQKLAYKAITEGAKADTGNAEAKKMIKDSWEKLTTANVKENAKDYWTGTGTKQDMKAASSEYWTGTGKNTTTETASGALGLLKGLWKLGEDTKKIAGVDSPLSPLLKSTKIVIEGSFDILQSFADTTEKVVGMTKTMRDYANEKGSKIPDIISFDPIKIGEKYALTDEMVSFVAKAIPATAIWDVGRFWTAPGTVKEKVKALQAGWTENKMLYSELVNPTIQEQYKLRAKTEDPNLLVLELQDPWIELAGEIILDPLNAFDVVGRMKKVGKAISEAEKITNVAHGLETVIDDLNAAQNIATEAQAIGKLDDVAKNTFDFIHDETGAVKKFGAQSYDVRAFNASGNQNRMTRNASNFIGAAIATVKSAGGKMDDVVDWLAATIKLSGSSDEVKEAIATFQASKVPTLWNFSQTGIETSVMLRNIIADGDVEAFVSKLQKNTGDWRETVKMLDEVIKDATRYAYPTIAEMSEAARKLPDLDNLLTKQSKAVEQIAELEAKIKDGMMFPGKITPKELKGIKKQLTQLNKDKNAITTSEKTLELAKRYKELKATRPGLVAMAELDRKVMKVVSPVNSFFAGTYFSLSYGFAFRNAITNAVVVVADAGWKSLFTSEKTIDDFFELQGIDPISLRTGFTAADALPMAKEGLIKETLNKLDTLKYSPKGLSQKFEVQAGKKVFYKFYRETMDTVVRAGVGLPGYDEWMKAGFSKVMVDDYIDLIKSNGYSVKDATEIMRTKYADGALIWTQLDFVNADVKAALANPVYGLWDKLKQLTTDPNVKSLDQVKEFIANAKQEAVKLANTADDPIGVASEAAVAEHIAETQMRFPDLVASGEVMTLEATENAFDNALSMFDNALGQARSKLEQAARDRIKQASALGKEADIADIDARIKKIDEWKKSAYNNSYRTEAHQTRNANNARWFDDLVPQVKPNGNYSGNAADYQRVWKENLDYFGPLVKDPGETWKSAFFRRGNEVRAEKNEEVWNNHFMAVLGSGDIVARDLGENFTDLFNASRQKLVDLQAMRHNVYDAKTGKMYFRAPKFTMAEVGTAGNGSNIAALGNAYGVSTITKSGAKDNHLLNIINEYLEKQYTAFEFKAKKLKTDDPLRYLIAKFPGGQNPGMSQQVFTDIFSEKNAFGKKGIPRNILNRAGGAGVDEVGTMLAEGGFISREQAQDQNFVISYLQDFAAGRPQSVESIASLSGDLSEEQITNLMLKEQAQGYSKLDDIPASLAEEVLQKYTGVKPQKGNLADHIPQNPVEMITPKTIPVAPEPIKLGEVPVKVAETAVPTGRFHGTSNPIDSVTYTFDKYQSGNLYGPGFYTTDNYAVSGEYTKKGKGKNPTIYKIDWVRDTPPNLIDLEKPFPKEVQDVINKATDYTPVNGFDFNQSGKDVYEQFKQAMRDEDVIRDVAEEEMDNLAYALTQQGYDGFSHVGGVKTGNAPHGVEIYFNPKDPVTGVENVKLTKIDMPSPEAAKAIPPEPDVLPQEALRYSDDGQHLVDGLGNEYDQDTMQLIKPNTDGLIQAPPDYIDGAMPTSGRAYKENLQGILEALTHVEDEITKRWGIRSTEKLDAAQINQMLNFSTKISDNVATAKYTASLVGEAYRDFTLLPYGQTTNLDHIASFIYPYQFWYSRSYTNWFKRITTNSALLANYARLKDTMASIYKDQPEWWKYNVKFPDFFGLNGGNPYMMNMEATIWPLNGLTGTDYNDPEKRASAFTATIDDMGKFGPSTWTPINLAIAGHYAIKGQKAINEGYLNQGQQYQGIASKWGGRMISQTGLLKSVSSYFGNPIELDPSVIAFNGKGPFDFSAADPFEEGKITRALAAMEAEKKYTKEQLMDAAYKQEGPIWNEAYQRAMQQKAGGQILSALFGVGFKTRTKEDMEVDNFYGAYSKVRNMHDAGFMSDEQYKQSFNELRQKYPFMDIILLSRRAGVGRESAYAYNVISRIPPGMTSEFYKSVGIDPETASKFYESGGKMENMGPLEQQDFLNGMVNLGAKLAIPAETTRAEWINAKNMYKQIDNEMVKRFGEDILITIQEYYGQDDKKQKDLMLANIPELSKALDIKQAYIVNNPELMKYYGGIDTIERYATSKLYDDLEAKYGTELSSLASTYKFMTPQEKKDFKQKYPEIRSYWNDQSEGYDKIFWQVVELGKTLPEAPTVTIREGGEASPKQAAIEAAAQPVYKMTFDDWSNTLKNEALMELIADYGSGGRALSSSSNKMLDSYAEKYGYPDGEALLQDILISIP